MKSLWFKITSTLILVTVVGVGAYVVLGKMSATAINVLVGGLLTLLIVIVVGGLFIGKDLVQAYILRRTVRDDDMMDLRQMAMLSSIMHGGSSKVSLTMPDYPMLEGGRPSAFDGAYRDTTARREIEVE